MNLPDLLDRRRNGHSLERSFYQDPQIFQQEYAAIFSREWLLVDHESRLGEPGEYFLFDVAGESLIIVRDREGVVRALFNVCRHRGSRIVEEASGKLSALTCSYHAWSYDLNGCLKRCRRMPQGFLLEDHGLHAAHVRILHGLIFVSLASGAAPDFSEIEALSANLLQVHGLAKAKRACSRTYRIAANWKLALENFHECYHCPSSHPQYTRTYAFVRAEEQIGAQASVDFQRLTQEWRSNAKKLGHPTPELTEIGSRTAGGGRVYRSPIGPGILTASQNGQPVAPLMGEYAKYDGGHTGILFNYLCGVAGYNDHAVTVSFIPIDVAVTDAVFTWLVDEAAIPGRDFDEAALCWLWDVTTLQDKDIIERNARGVASRRYVPGPYSELEPELVEFMGWYSRRMSDAPSSVGG